MTEAIENRPLTPAEFQLIRWMLEHGEPEAKQFLGQLESARATTWRCPCGCASIDLVVDDHPPPTSGMHPIAHFIFGEDEDLNGIYVYEQSGVLGGVEVYGLPGDAAKSLPTPDALRPFPQQQRSSL